MTGWRQREEDRLIVQSGGTTCGSGDPVAWTGVDFPIVAQITATDGTEAVYFLGTPTSGVPGNEYVVCWAYEPLSNANYLVTLDSVGELVGPDVAELTCTMGNGCDFSLSGYQLGTSYQMVVLESGNCGDTDAVIADWGSSFTTNWAASDGTASAEGVVHTLGTAFAGAPGGAYKLCWGFNPAGVYDYKVPQKNP